MPTAIITAMIELIQLGVSVVPQVISAAQTAVSLIESGSDPTPEEQAQIDAALDAAHAALQAATPS
jgi:hypothetical protein